jgi:hypothetical protein
LLAERLSRHPGLEAVPLSLRGRATGILLTAGHPRQPLTELARQAGRSGPADRYRTPSRGAAAEAPEGRSRNPAESLPPRIMGVTGGEVAGNVLPSYEVVWRLVRRDRKRRRHLALDRRRAGRLDPCDGQQRCGAGRAAGESAQRRHDHRGPHGHAPNPPGDARASGRDERRDRTLGPRDPRAPTCELRPCAAGDPAALRAKWTGCALRRDEALVDALETDTRRAQCSAEPGDRLLMVSDGVMVEGEGSAWARRRDRSGHALRAPDRGRHGPPFTARSSEATGR